MCIRIKAKKQRNRPQIEDGSHEKGLCVTRSRRRHSHHGITTARSEKQDKRIANRKHRRIIRQRITPDTEQLPTLREVSNPWNMAKDGKLYFDAAKHRKLMRK